MAQGENSAATGLDHNSSRKIAQTRNDASNFMEGPAYDPTHGLPVTETLKVQPYKDAAQEQAPRGTGAPPSAQIVPFTITGG